MKSRLEIVVTNDDGISAPGLLALAKAAMNFGNVTVIAPDKNWSASGHQKALGRPLRVEPYQLPLEIPAFAIDGGPSDCTALAGLGFLDKKVDLVLSGVNNTANVSRDITYSGTVTAALEATIWDMKGIAFSIDAGEKSAKAIDFSITQEIVSHVLQIFLPQEIPPYTILNVNFPEFPPHGKPVYRVTRQGDRIYRDELIRRVDPFGRPYYWFGGLPPNSDFEPGTDCGELSRGFVSITPIDLDLTAHDQLSKLENWNWNRTNE